MTWLKTYAASVRVCMGFVCLMYVLSDVRSVDQWRAAVLVTSAILLLTGALRAGADAVDARDAKTFLCTLHNIHPSEFEKVLQDLATRLDDAYRKNVAFQKGDYVLDVCADTDDLEAMTRFYKKERAEEERRLKRDIAIRKARFWNVAHLLRRWNLNALPKSYKNCL